MRGPLTGDRRPRLYPTTASPATSDVLIAHNNTGTHDLALIYKQSKIANARYYLPEIGRFISPDTIVPEPGNPQSYNRYSYTQNNPVNFTDPSGHMPCYRICPGESINSREYNFLSAYQGPWNLDQQRANSQRAEALLVNVVTTISGFVFEPADWAIALSDGLQWYDGVGMLPLMPASLGDNLGRFVARYSDELIQFVRLVDNPTFRNLTYGNFRENLSQFTGFMPSNDFQAHHVLPEKFSDRFEKAEFVGENNIHIPLFGSWVLRSEHQGWTRAYQDRWDRFSK